jgi:hypothetical protein
VLGVSELTRVRISTFRHALGLVVVAFGGVVAVLIALFSMATGDVSEALWITALVVPAVLGLLGGGLVMTCRYAIFDAARQELSLPGQVRLPFDRLRAVWLVAGPSASVRSVLLMTDLAGDALLGAVASADAELEGGATETPAAKHLRGAGVLEAIRTPPAGALHVLVEAASEERAERILAELATLLKGLVVLDMGDPTSPTFRRLRKA